MKICSHKGCEKPTMTNRHKYCSPFCKYWASQIKKETNAGWGSKNSQMRLDIKARRFAKRMTSGKTGVRFN
jgi:hypothetical protein